MIWDWTINITLGSSILFSILSVIIFYVIGASFNWFVCKVAKKNDWTRSLSFFQKINFRILLGSFYIIFFILLFSILNLSFLTTALLVVGTAIGLPLIFFILISIRTKESRQKIFKDFKNIFRKIGFAYFKKNGSTFFIIFILFVILALSANSIAGFFGSTNDDGAFHTTMIRVILDSPSTLFSRNPQPYADFIITYPLGSHSLCSFLVTLLSVPIQEIVIMMSATLPCLIALAFYSTVHSLFKNKAIALISMLLAGFFSITYSWGPFSWGGLPLLFSLYISISSIGLIYLLLNKMEFNGVDAFILGLTFFVSIQIYPVAFLFITIWFILFGLFTLKDKITGLPKLAKPKSFSLKKIALLILFLIPVMLSLPYLYTAFSYSNMSLQNYPADVPFDRFTNDFNNIIEKVRINVSFNWLMDIPAITNFFQQFGDLLGSASLAIVVLFILIFSNKVKKINKLLYPDLSKTFVKNFLLIFCFFIITMSYLTIATNFPISFLGVFDPNRVIYHIFILGDILATLVIYCLFCLSKSALNFLSDNELRFASRNYKKMRIVFLGLFSLVILVIGGFSFTSEFVQIYSGMGWNLNHFGTLTSDDISLMSWIKENTPKDAIFLVTASDSGQYLTAVTQRLSVYSYDARIYSMKYNQLLEILISNPSNSTAIPYLREYNISYVYIGSKATDYSLEDPFRNHFNATKFLDSPYFYKAMNTGNSWLFSFNSSVII